MPGTGHRASPAWRPEEDRRLLDEKARGARWNDIRQRYFPGKTGNACRKRYERLIARRSEDDWDTEKFELLAMKYLELRREMWYKLALSVDAPWEQVEKKCFDKGLSHLQTVGRRARRQRTAFRPAPSTEPGSLPEFSDSSTGTAENPMDFVAGPYIDMSSYSFTNYSSA